MFSRPWLKAQRCLSRAPLALIFGATASVFAQNAVPAPETEPRERRGVMRSLADNGPVDVFRHSDLVWAARHSGMVFDGILVNAHTFTPPGARILVTEYTFQVHEWFAGSNGQAFVTIREAGGEDEHGNGMTTCYSHRLDVQGRYLVFLRSDFAQSLIPFNRVLQVMDNGQTVADERGHIAVDLRAGRLITRSEAETNHLQYIAPPPGEAQHIDVGAPFADPGYEPAITNMPEPIIGNPIHAEVIFQALRPLGAKAPAGPAPAGLSSHVGGVDHLRCGYIDRSTNFRGWLQDNNNYSWTNSAMIDWNDLADNAHRWIFGYITSGGQPIRNELPTANDSNHHIGVPTSQQMIDGGYGGGWASYSNANGLCFRWYVGAASNCGRIRETDVFANPSIQSNELQFRKTMVHELGHALGFDHEDRYVAIMVSGTWRVPPLYSGSLYNRMDETLGGRNMLNFVNNSISSGTWVLRQWRDLATISQSHPNWGSSGDVGTNMTRLSTYSANGGQQVSLQRIYNENRGNVAFSNTVTFRVYLSTDTTITTADTQVWSGTWPSYPAHGFSNNWDLNFTVPSNLPSGNYYVGWILSTTEAEHQAGNNTGLLRNTAGNNFAPLTLSVNNPEPTGACCFNDGTCLIRTSAQCSSQGGTYAGNNVTCAAANCPQPGACCFDNGSCQIRTSIQCALQLGVYRGNGTTCATANCPQPGACCFEDGSCLIRSALNCSLEGGNYAGDGTTCAGINCPTIGKLIPIPAFNNTFSSASLTRGMWFEAPADFIITGLRVPDESNHGLQNVEVVRLAAPPPNFANTTNNFVSLYRRLGASSDLILPVHIPVSKGDFIGVLGACGDETTMRNSYGVGGLYEATFLGRTTTVRRLGMQSNLVVQPAQALWTDNFNSPSRVEIYYKQPLGAETLETAASNNGRSDNGAGIFMNITPSKNLTVTGFDYYTQITAGQIAAVELWKRSGSYVSFIGAPAGWTLHERVDVISAGPSTATTIHLSKPLPLSANETTGFYLVGIIGGIRYTGIAGNPPQTTFADSNLSLYSEHARGGPPFTGPLFTPRTFSGSVNYTLSGPSLVLPNEYTSALGDSGRNTLIRDLERTAQFIVHASELAAVPHGTPITGLAWRLAASTSTTWPAADVRWTDYDIQISASPNTPGTVSSTFASNIGADNVTVRTGALTIPAGSFSATGSPRPFGPVIPFTTPYIYNGGNLLFTIRHVGNGTSTAFLDSLSTAASGSGVRFAYLDAISATAATGAIGGNFPITQLTIVSQECYANCDGSTQAPVLNVDDFTCFINKFAQAQGLPHAQQLTHYANCDGSTQAPVLNVDDFTCFINKFAAGCP